MTTDTLLQAHCLSGGYRKGMEILHDVSLTVMGGEAVGVVGLNGSGKSTLGKALIGALPYFSGDISLTWEQRDGIIVTERIDGMSTMEIARRGMVMMQQGGSVFRNLSVRDNIRLAFDREGVSKTKDLLYSMIPLLSDPRKAGVMADRLSGGERQALSLAMVLSGGPGVVILDEPSAGLSPADVNSTFSLLSALRGELGMSIILIEQNITRAVGFCDRCILLESGRVVSEYCDKDIHQIEDKLFNNY